jgi:alpha-L-rhamnosidase
MLASIALAAVFAFQLEPRPEWIGPPAPAEGPAPHWVWVSMVDCPPVTARGAPEGSVWVVRDFEAPDDVICASLSVAADNHARVYLNGEVVLEADDWGAPVFAEVKPRPGANVLCIEARNGPIAGAAPGTGVNPAGVAARLELRLRDGSVRWVVTDESWRGSLAKPPGFPSGAEFLLPTVTDLGPCSTAPWGVPAAAFGAPRPCPILRRSFTLERAPASATVRVIGLGHYELRCNGRVVGDTLINQSWSQYDRTLYWQDFDLAPYLHEGENVIGVSLGNSFWQVAAANDAHRFTKTDAMPDFSQGWPHLLWLDATIETGDPAHPARIVSDASWTWDTGPVTFSNLYAGEDYDARLAQPGWDAPGFDGAAWRPVALAPAPAGEPAPLIGPGIEAFEVFGPSEIRAVDPDAGVYTYVFPQNCSALLRFTVTGGGSGSRVRFRPCEYMEPDGRVRFTYTWGTGKDIWLDYTKAGPGDESHRARFFYVGAQFVQVEGAVPAGSPNPGGLPEVVSLELVHTRAACAEVGEFESSSPMHDGAERLIDWSIRSNMSHVPTDCPHREKNGWQEENWHMARAMSYRYDTSAWMARNCRAVRDAQSAGGEDDGFVPTNCPWYLVGRPRHDMFNDATEWGVSVVLVPWHLYEWYGDDVILEENYDAARRFVDYMGRTAEDGIVDSNLGDWYDFGHGMGNGPSRWTPNQVSATAVWAYAADTVSRMASVLGRDSDAASYRALYEQIRRDFQRHFYDPATHTVRNNGSCQAGTAAALCVGLIPEADREAALDAIVADLESRGWKQTPGEVLQVFLIRALAENGRGEVLHRVYNRDDIPSFGHMVASGLTTLPESWDARRGTGDSLNHFMLGHLLEWHYAYVAGIRQAPGSVGWSRILIAPQPPARDDASPHAISHCRASFESPRGTITSEWRAEPSGGGFVLTCEIPPGVEAAALLPDGTRRSLAAGRNSLRWAR